MSDYGPSSKRCSCGETVPVDVGCDCGSALPQGSPPNCPGNVTVKGDTVTMSWETWKWLCDEDARLRASVPAKELAQAILRDFGSVPVGPDHENYTHEDYLVELALQVMGRDGPPGEPSEIEKLAAMLLCEVGRVWDPRLADVRPIVLADALKRGARTFDAKAEPLTNEQVRAVLAEHFGGPSGGAATP